MSDALSIPSVPVGASDLDRDLIPARMLNEWVYCPRLAYLEWVQGEFEDSVDTVEGRHQHRRVDVAGPLLPDPEDIPEGETPPIIHARSILLSAPDPGIIARMDLVEAEGRTATPVDYKHGKKPDRPEGAWDPDIVQIAAQALVLRANGYRCERGIVYYVGSRDRVEVPITDALLDRVREVAAALRRAASSPTAPAPLDDSPKCAGCSLVGICLPDETRCLSPKTHGHQARGGRGPSALSDPPRRVARVRRGTGRLRVKAGGMPRHQGPWGEGGRGLDDADEPTRGLRERPDQDSGCP